MQAADRLTSELAKKGEATARPTDLLDRLEAKAAMATLDVFHQCLREVAHDSGAALERCIDSAMASLQLTETQTEKRAERDTLSQAWRQLQTSKQAWLARYPSDLLTCFSADDIGPLTSAPRHKAITKNPHLGIDAFSLADDADVAPSIESSRLLQSILPVVEQSLAELDTLISSAQLSSGVG